MEEKMPLITTGITKKLTAKSKIYNDHLELSGII
jgi:hypothetical protein